MSSRPTIAVVDYGVGNLRSAGKALERAASEAGVAADVRVTSVAADVDRAAAVVLPGVGAFGACMKSLEGSGMVDSVRRAIDSGRPFLGICIGMQLLFEESEEFGPVRGLGVLPGRVVRFRSAGVKIPQIGWNSLTLRPGVPGFAGIADGTYFYFVHSYYAVPADPAAVAATAVHGDEEFCAAVCWRNVLATQFHPEKSQAAGLRLLRNFVAPLGRVGAVTATGGGAKPSPATGNAA